MMKASYIAPQVTSAVYLSTTLLAESDELKRKDGGRLVGKPQSVSWDLSWDFTKPVYGSDLPEEE